MKNFSIDKNANVSNNTQNPYDFQGVQVRPKSLMRFLVETATV